MGRGIKGLGISDAFGQWTRENRPDVWCTDRTRGSYDPTTRRRKQTVRKNIGPSGNLITSAY